MQTWLGSALLWLWRRPVATVLIGSLAREPPYATDMALKDKKTHTHTQKKMARGKG